jgi:hypothetical protein
MSVAWLQKTVKGLGPPGSQETADPYTESGERRARVRIAWVRSCKTLIMGSNPIVASRQHQTTAGNDKQQARALRAGRAPRPIPNRLFPKLRQGVVFVDCVVLSVVSDRVSERLSEPFGDLITTEQTDNERARNELVRLEDAIGLERTPRPTIMEFTNEIGELPWTDLTLSPLGKAFLKIGLVETELTIMSRLHDVPLLLAELLSVSQGTA